MVISKSLNLSRFPTATFGETRTGTPDTAVSPPLTRRYQTGNDPESGWREY